MGFFFFFSFTTKYGEFSVIGSIVPYRNDFAQNSPSILNSALDAMGTGKYRLSHQSSDRPTSRRHGRLVLHTNTFPDSIVFSLPSSSYSFKSYSGALDFPYLIILSQAIV